MRPTADDTNPLRPMGDDLPGWEYDKSPSKTGVSLRGWRADTPAGIPLVTAAGMSLATALDRLREKAREWDAETRAGR